MTKFDIQAAARADLREIYAFSVDRFGRPVADSYLLGLRGCFDRLLDFPAIGRIYPGVTPEIPVLSYRRHRVFYRVVDDQLLVVRILHERRNIGEKL
ncbi:MAG: hypothetical protein B7Y43_02230 [Sphingomonas sp. 28-62-20]|uniref:type II toxin-antitoxin system RelE/ParE family toxin n=1 Tax=Sphingomonas sp. 28-62-20 TaxID=1970433 RepID=UPI000BC854C0|nr:MAG: hypothetical protein B7Y43_02230 [Sphingomonas sp. 28-62-20]